MILVVLGTQDKPFDRLLEAVDVEIENGTIKDEVIVQAGHTKYESENMKIFDFLSTPEFEKLIKEANIIITHGGVGTILSSIKRGKKVIAAPRLSKYKEHQNDHQKQIIHEFSERGLILEYGEDDDLGKIIKKCRRFKPKKFESNTKNMIKLISNYIEDTDHTAWYHKYRELISYLFFGGCTTLVNIISFMILRVIHLSTYVSNGIAWFLSVLFAFVTNKLFVFESKNTSKKQTMYEAVSFFGCRILSLFFDMGIMYLMIDVLGCNELLSKIVSNIFVIIINYIFSKMIIFKK